MPSRSESLRIALPYILPQVDRLYLYLDKHDAIPEEFKSNPKIIPVLPQGGVKKELGGRGKFIGLRLEKDPCIFVCFDDDIIYRDGYVNHLVTALKRYHCRAVVGIHAGIYKFPNISYVKERTIVHFEQSLTADILVDELGTGTIAFHSGVIHIDPELWDYNNMIDLHFMLEAIKQKVPRVCIRRGDDFLKAIGGQDQPDSIYRQSLRDDSRQTRLLQAAMEQYPDNWCMT